MNKLLSGSIRQAQRLLEDRSITPIDLTRACLAKEKESRHLNAFVTVAESVASRQAEASTERHANRTPLSELDGIPIAVKDNFCTSGVRTSCASKMLERFVPTYDATVCERLSGKGAVLVGKTNLDQFAMGSGTVDSTYGCTRNPWGYGADGNFHIAGGSSGGSAVSVAVGSSFAALGSDTGGSTRNPASYCGVVGLKPTYGLVSRLGLIPLVNSMDVPGILTRTVDDCVAVLNVVAGYDPKDSTSLTKPYKPIRLPRADKLGVKDLRIGVPVEYHCENLDAEVLQTWNEVAKLLRQGGAAVKQVSLPHTELSIVTYSVLNQCEVASNMARYDGVEFGHRSAENSSTEKLYATGRSTGFNEVVRNRILTGNYFLLTRNYDKYFNQALKVRRLISDDFYNVWEDVQILLTPTTLSTAPKYADFVKKTNRDQCAMQDFCTQPANMAGIPAISVPIKLSSQGLPISLQLMGRNLSEPMLLALAKYIEHAVQFPRQQYIGYE